MKLGCAICILLNSENLICQSTDISKCFSGSLQLRDNESRLYIVKLYTGPDFKSGAWSNEKGQKNGHLNSRSRLFKTTMSLVNVSLKFQTFISNICQYFLLKKCEKLLQC